MGKNNRYAAPVTDGQPDPANSGAAVATTSTTDAAGVDTLSTETGVGTGAAPVVDTSAPETGVGQDANTLSAEEVAALSGGDAAANPDGPKGDDIKEEPAVEQTRLDGGVAVEEPSLPEAVATPAPAPAPEVAAAPAPVPTPAPAPVVAIAPPAVAIPTPAPAPVAAPAAEPIATASELANRIELLKKEGTNREKALIVTIEGYINNMMPGKPVDEKAGATHQLTLWRTIQSVVERSAGDEFRTLYSLLLDIVAEHQHKRGVFYDKFVFRFADHLTFGKDEQKSFLALLNVIILTANRNTRHIGKKQVDMNRVASAGFTEQGRQNLLAFYK